jgi:PAS domain S-box-containing protein
MTILIVSPDGDAARSLSSALGRRGHESLWLENVEAARAQAAAESPLVVVVDRALDRFHDYIDDVAVEAPWVRVYEMTDSVGDAEGRAVLKKPFDAAETAALLGRERELAELDRRRYTLQAKTDELALLVEASFEVIIGLGADGSVRSWNRGARNIYGYEPEEILGKPVHLLDISDARAKSRIGERTSDPVEIVRRRKDGREVLVLLSRSPVPNGTTIAFAETSLDITMRRELERELEHEKRLAAIGRIAASMAHEINNPLAVLRAANSYVADVARASGDELLLETVEDVRIAADRIGGFVNHVCGFARRDRPTLSDTSVRETVRMALRLAKPRAADRRVDMALEPGADVRIPHDAARISQAILNLVSNAIDAAADGGRHVLIRVLRDESSVRVQVDDDGPGLAEAIQGRAFEPFATTKPQGMGTGLGLAITRQIVDEHGGNVTLGTYAATSGARAEVTLPIVGVGEPRQQQ